MKNEGLGGVESFYCRHIKLIPIRPDFGRFTILSGQKHMNIREKTTRKTRFRRYTQI